MQKRKILRNELLNMELRNKKWREIVKIRQLFGSRWQCGLQHLPWQLQSFKSTFFPAFSNSIMKCPRPKPAFQKPDPTQTVPYQTELFLMKLSVGGPITQSFPYVFLLLLLMYFYFFMLFCLITGDLCHLLSPPPRCAATNVISTVCMLLWVENRSPHSHFLRLFSSNLQLFVQTWVWGGICWLSINHFQGLYFPKYSVRFHF